MKSYLNKSQRFNLEDIQSIIDNHKQSRSAKEAVEAKLRKGNYSLSTNDLGQIMLDYYYFTKISDHLLVYVDRSNNPNFGVYTSNYKYIEQQMSRDYPQFKHRMFNDVILYIKSRVSELNLDNNERLIKDLIPVNNGIFDFKNKKLLDFDPKYVFTNKIVTNYNSSLTGSPEINGWNVNKFLNNLSNGDYEIVKQFWQIILDAVDGNHCRRKLILLYSDNQGSNGKSTFQSLLQNLVGRNNYSSLKISQFDKRFMLADLVNKAVDIGDNLPTSLKINHSSNVNSVVTGDNVQIEQKNQDPYSAHLKCTVVQSCNGLPTFKDTGGIKRRLLIIPFNNHFFGHKDNPRVKNDYLKRKDVKEYILHQALHQRFFDQMYVSKASRKALIDYEYDNYPIIQFKINHFDEWKIPKITTKLVFNLYNNFVLNSDEFHESHYTQRMFTRIFKSLIRDNYIEKPAKITKLDQQRLMKLKHGKGFGNIQDSDIPSTDKTLNCFVMI